MSDSKPVASLGPLLLARKGTAKPAMRAHLDEHARGEIAGTQDELGWNDMGEDFPARAEPEVRRQQARLVHSVADSNVARLRPGKRRRKAVARHKPAGDAHRAAFTLRLDDERHLRLKLASTVQGESAQQLVTRALDLLLDTMPEIETLAAQVKRGTSKA